MGGRFRLSAIIRKLVLFCFNFFDPGYRWFKWRIDVPKASIEHGFSWFSRFIMIDLENHENLCSIQPTTCRQFFHTIGILKKHISPDPIPIISRSKPDQIPPFKEWWYLGFWRMLMMIFSHVMPVSLLNRLFLSTDYTHLREGNWPKVHGVWACQAA